MTPDAILTIIIAGEPLEFILTHCRPPQRPTTLTSNLNNRLSVAYLRFQMILSAIFVMLCLCDICCYVDKKQIRRLGRLVEPSGLINNHIERPLRTRNQSKMSHFVATVWFTSVNKVRVCIIISLFLFTKGTLYSHSGFEKFEKKQVWNKSEKKFEKNQVRKKEMATLGEQKFTFETDWYDQ